jgi:hypothetical protein
MIPVAGKGSTVAALIVVFLLASLATAAVLIFGVVTTTRMGRRKGYRGPFLSLGLGVFATVMAIGGMITAALSSDRIGNPLLLVGLFAGVTALTLAVSWSIVALLPRRVVRVPGIRRSGFPFRGLAIVLWISVVVGPVCGLVLGLGVQESLRLVTVLGPAAGACSAWGRRTRTRQAEDPAELDDGSAVLLLRSFREEGRMFSVSDQRSSRTGIRRWLGILFPDQREDFLTAERYLGPAFAEAIGPLVGLGNPMDYLPPEGPVLRYYAADADWQAEIERLIPQVRAILVLASASTANLSWELRQIRTAGAVIRTFLIVPVQQGSVRRWVERFVLAAPPFSWPKVVEDLRKLGYQLPDTSPGPGSVLGFDDAGRALVLTSGAQSARDYVAAVARGLERSHDHP